MDVPTKRTRLEEPAAAAAAKSPEHPQGHSQRKEGSATQEQKRGKKCKDKKKGKAGFVRDDPTWTGCRCWLKHKGRYCKFARFGGTFYCPHHLSEATGSATSTAGKGGSTAAATPSAAAKTIARRIPCPYDPSHDVYEHRLKKHLKKCPKYKEALAGASMPYYRKGYNSCSAQNDSEQPLLATSTSTAVSAPNTNNAVLEYNKNSPTAVRIHDYDDGDDDEAFMLRVGELYSKHVTPIENSFLTVNLHRVQLFPSLTALGSLLSLFDLWCTLSWQLMIEGRRRMAATIPPGWSCRWSQKVRI